MIVLLAAMLGVWLRRLRLAFWLPFCLVGWLYLATSLTTHRLAGYLPSRYISYRLEGSELPTSERKYNVPYPHLEREEVLLYLDHLTVRSDTVQRYFLFAEILDALSAIVAGGFAGVFASILVRKKREP